MRWGGEWGGGRGRGKGGGRVGEGRRSKGGGEGTAIILDTDPDGGGAEGGRDPGWGGCIHGDEGVGCRVVGRPRGDAEEVFVCHFCPRRKVGGMGLIVFIGVFGFWNGRSVGRKGSIGEVIGLLR